jgi:hypothetical protein
MLSIRDPTVTPAIRRPCPEHRESKPAGTQLALLHTELQHKQDYAGRLEYLLHLRTETVDALHAKIAQLRVANQKLDAEAERYYQMLAAG